MHRSLVSTPRRPRGLLARLAGTLAIAVFLSPSPLAGQERAVRVRPVGQAAGLATIDARVDTLLGTPEAAQRISARLTHRDRLVARRIGERLREGASFEDVRGEWAELVGRTEPGDVNGLVQFVLREGYLEEVQTGRQAAERVRQANERKRALREERTRLAERLRAIDEELERSDSDAQLANFDMQTALQKQQQALQAMSNMSKQMHDTAMSIIQNMR